MEDDVDWLREFELSEKSSFIPSNFLIAFSELMDQTMTLPSSDPVANKVSKQQQQQQHNTNTNNNNDNNKVKPTKTRVSL